MSCAWSTLDGSDIAPRPSLHGYEGLSRPLGASKRLTRNPSRLHTSMEVTRCRIGNTSRQSAPVGYENFFPQKDWKPISHAVYYDREAALQHFLQAGCSPDLMEGPGVPLLCIAAACGHFEIAKILLKAGADVDLATSDKGETAMHVACKAGRNDIIDLLLVHRANLESRTLHTDQTALHYAAAGPNSIAMVTKLLKFGARYDAEDQKGQTPAVVALQSHNLQTAVAIVNMARGKRKQLVREKSMLIQHMEKAKDTASVTNDLLANVFAATCDPDSTVLIEAIKKNDFILVQMFLEEGVDPRQAATTGLLPLIVAAKFSDLRIIKLLIQHGADITDRGPGNLDILQILFKTFTTRDEDSVVTIVEYLLAKGGDCTTRYPDGKTLLHRAVSMRTDHARIVKVLIRHGVAIDWQDKDGSTALHLAASNGLAITIKTLLDYNADSTLVDSQTRTALLRAIRNQQWHVVPLLASPPAMTSRDAQGSTALHHIAHSIPKEDTTWRDIVVAARAFCERRACRSMRDRSGATPLIQAVKILPEDGLPLIEVLITEGHGRWNCIGHEDHKGHDALYYAAILGKPVFVQALLDHNAPFIMEQWTDPQKQAMLPVATRDRILELLTKRQHSRYTHIVSKKHDDGPWTRIEIVRSEPRSNSALSGYHADSEMDRKTKGGRINSKRSPTLRPPHTCTQHRKPPAASTGFPTRTTSFQQGPENFNLSYRLPVQATHARNSSASSLSQGVLTNTKTVRFTRHNDQSTETTELMSTKETAHQSRVAYPPRSSSRQQITVLPTTDTIISETTATTGIPSLSSKELVEPSDSDLGCIKILSVPLVKPISIPKSTDIDLITAATHERTTEGITPTFEEAIEPTELQRPYLVTTNVSGNTQSTQPTRMDSAVSVTQPAKADDVPSTLDRSQATLCRTSSKTKRRSADELASWLAISNMLDRL